MVPPNVGMRPGSEEPSAPRLSVVVTGRNDDYGGDFRSRFELFAQTLLTQFEELGLSGELVIVEWNPPSDRPRLADAVHWPAVRAV